MSTPEQDTAPMEARLGCFNDNTRICGSDCMAYLAQAPIGKAYLGENWAHCKLLVTADQVGRHIIMITDLFSKVRATQVAQERSKPPPGVV